MRLIIVMFKLPCIFSVVSLRRNAEVGLWQSFLSAVPMSILRANS